MVSVKFFSVAARCGSLRVRGQMYIGANGDAAKWTSYAKASGGIEFRIPLINVHYPAARFRAFPF